MKAEKPSLLEIKRIALLNRGEAAMRFLRLTGVQYRASDADRSGRVVHRTRSEAPFVRLADHTVALGHPLVSDGLGGMKSVYCVYDRIMGILRDTGCDAVWPGWGFVSEDAAFVEKLEQAGILFLGPSSGAMVRLGDNI